MSCVVRGYGHRSASTLFPFPPVHPLPVLRWPACVWSVYCRVAAAAAVWLVRGCVGRLMVCLVCVCSVALLPVFVQPNVVCVVGMSVSVLVSCVLVRFKCSVV